MLKGHLEIHTSLYDLYQSPSVVLHFNHTAVKNDKTTCKPIGVLS